MIIPTARIISPVSQTANGFQALEKCANRKNGQTTINKHPINQPVLTRFAATQNLMQPTKLMMPPTNIRISASILVNVFRLTSDYTDLDTLRFPGHIQTAAHELRFHPPTLLFPHGET